MESFNNLSKKPLILSISTVLLAVSTLIYSCVNDDPDSGQLSQQFLMGDVKVSLTETLVGAPLKEDVVLQARKSKRLIGGAVIVNNMAFTANGKEVMFFDSNNALAQAKTHTMFMASKSTNDLLVVIPGNSAIVVATTALLKKGDESILADMDLHEFYSFVESDEMANVMSKGAEQHFTSKMGALLAAGEATEIVPTLALELLQRSLLDSFEVNQYYTTRSGETSLSTRLVFKQESNALVEKTSGVTKFDPITLKPDDNGKPMHEIVIDILDEDGSFSCSYVDENAQTLFYAVKCEFDVAYFEKLKKLRRMSDNFIAAKFQSPASVLEKTAAQNYYNAVPGTSFWAISIPIGKFVEKGINRLLKDAEDDSSEIVSFTSAAEFVEKILRDADFHNQPVVSDLVGIRAYIGQVLPQGVVANLFKKYKGNGPVEEMLKGIIFSEELANEQPADLKSGKITDVRYDVDFPQQWSKEDVLDFTLLSSYQNGDGVSFLGTSKGNSAKDAFLCSTSLMTREELEDKLALQKQHASIDTVELVALRAFDRNGGFSKFCTDEVVTLSDTLKDVAHDIAKYPPLQELYSYEFFVGDKQEVQQTTEGLLEF